MENRAENYFSRRKFVGTISAGIGGFMFGDAMAGTDSAFSAGDSSLHFLVASPGKNMIGAFGEWAAQKMDAVIPSHSLRNKAFTSVDAWRTSARNLVADRIAMPDLGGTTEVKVRKQYSYDGLQTEELSWQLPYGRPAKAIFLKPAGAKGPLPGMKKADEILSEVFAKANASAHYRCSFYSGGHKFGRGMQMEAFGWFDKWLK